MAAADVATLRISTTGNVTRWGLQCVCVCRTLRYATCDYVITAVWTRHVRGHARCYT